MNNNNKASYFIRLPHTIYSYHKREILKKTIKFKLFTKNKHMLSGIMLFLSIFPYILC